MRYTSGRRVERWRSVRSVGLPMVWGDLDDECVVDERENGCRLAITTEAWCGRNVWGRRMNSYWAPGAQESELGERSCGESQQRGHLGGGSVCETFSAAKCIWYFQCKYGSLHERLMLSVSLHLCCVLWCRLVGKDWARICISTAMQSWLLRSKTSASEMAKIQISKNRMTSNACRTTSCPWFSVLLYNAGNQSLVYRRCNVSKCLIWV